jgi:hypothetical protein
MLSLGVFGPISSVASTERFINALPYLSTRALNYNYIMRPASATRILTFGRVQQQQKSNFTLSLRNAIANSILVNSIWFILAESFFIYDCNKNCPLLVRGFIAFNLSHLN